MALAALHASMRIHAWTHTRTHVRTHICTCAHTHARLYACIHMHGYIDAETYARMYSRIHARMHDAYNTHMRIYARINVTDFHSRTHQNADTLQEYIHYIRICMSAFIHSSTLVCMHACRCECMHVDSIDIDVYARVYTCTRMVFNLRSLQLQKSSSSEIFKYEVFYFVH